MFPKKRKNNNSISVIIFLLIVLLLFVFALPLIVFLGYLYYQLKILKYKMKISHIQEEFWLSNEEKNDFFKLHGLIEDAKSKIILATKNGLDEGLKTNKDGSFSRRGEKGKRLQEIIDTQRNIINCNNEEYYNLIHLPHNMWKSFFYTYIFYNSFRITFITWLVTMLFCSFYYFDNFIHGFIRLSSYPLYFIKNFSIFFEANNKNYQTKDLMIWVIASGISMVMFGCLYLYFKKSKYLLDSQPPLVTINNYENY